MCLNFPENHSRHYCLDWFSAEQTKKIPKILLMHKQALLASLIYSFVLYMYKPKPSFLLKECNQICKSWSSFSLNLDNGCVQNHSFFFFFFYFIVHYIYYPPSTFGEGYSNMNIVPWKNSHYRMKSSIVYPLLSAKN